MRPIADAAGAALVIGFFWVLPPGPADRWPTLLAGAVLAAATGGAMILRRRRPAVATVTAGVATLAGTVLGVCQDPMLATAWCLYALAVQRAARTRLLGLVPAALVGVLVLVAGVPEGFGPGPAERLAIAVAALSVAWLLGSAVGRQVMAAQEAERARVQLEVARDVHDLVGHALGVIRAQAGVTLTFPDAREPELRATLVDVESRARAALEDVQTLVRALRDPDGGRVPAPDQLSSVIAATRAAGVRVEARIEAGGRIGERTGMVVFRIVQEALSNVVRHAPGADCSVGVYEEADAVLVEVHDTGRRSPVTGGAGGGGTGVGLRGLRERAALVGGTVTWESRPGGGFAVHARLPVRGAR